MIINMGPQHPSTHGVLRLMLELEGETVLRTKPIVGYLHTGMEKTGEDLTYLQGPTNVTRMDYAAPLFNELVFSLTTEKLLGIDEDIPERAQWIRMLLTELNRITSNLLFLATNGMDIGAVSMMIYGWRDREEGLRLLEMITGLRMNHNYIRPGGVAADLPDGWRDAVLTFIDSLPAEPRRVRRAPHRPADLPRAAPGRRRHHRAGGHRPRRHRPDPALHRRAVGPPPRHALPPLRAGRVRRRRRHLRRLLRPLRHPPQRDPRVDPDHPPDPRRACRTGDYRIQDKKVTPPPRARIDESMEALIHHFKIFTEGFKVPEGEAYMAIESPRGELGCYIVSDGSAKPYRMHIRGPSFVNLQTLPHMMRGGLIADAVAVISSRRSDHGRGRPLMARLSAENTITAKEIIARYPRPKSALIPLLHLAQEQDGYVADDAMAHIAELIGVTPAEVLGTCSFYEMFKREPVGEYLVNVCTNISCMLLGGEELLHHLEDRLGIKAGQHHPRRHLHHRGRRVHRGVHRGAVPPGELPLLLQGHPRRRRRAHRRPAARPPGPRGAQARRPRPHPPAAPADRRAGNAVPGECRGARRGSAPPPTRRRRA